MYKIISVMLLSLFLFAGCSAKQVSLTSLDKSKIRILLTNDDGCDSPGILQLKQKLQAEGYDVWLSAPATNQSGIGTAITFKPGRDIDIKKIDNQSYCFPGTPSDSLDFAVLGFMRDTPPYLVISGVNDGPNTGIAQVNSGTIGAAVRAVKYGFPAIAASIGYNLDEANKGYPSTKKYWPESIDYVVAIVNTLVEKEYPGPLLPKNSGISINYPALPKSEIKGVKYAFPLENPEPQFVYKIKDNGKAVMMMSDAIFIRSAGDHDSGALDAGYIVYTIFDADWSNKGLTKTYMKILGDKPLQ